VGVTWGRGLIGLLDLACWSLGSPEFGEVIRAVLLAIYTVRGGKPVGLGRSLQAAGAPGKGWRALKSADTADHSYIPAA
jgi:hypothetical protein